MSYEHTFTPTDPPWGQQVRLRINAETERTCLSAVVNWLADPGEVVVTLDEEATGQDLTDITAIVDDADYQPPAYDPEYMAEDYEGNKLVARTVYADAAMTLPYTQVTFEYKGKALWKETLTEYSPVGEANSVISWEYETENLGHKRRRVTKKRIA